MRARSVASTCRGVSPVCACSPGSPCPCPRHQRDPCRLAGLGHWSRWRPSARCRGGAIRLGIPGPLRTCRDSLSASAHPPSTSPGSSGSGSAGESCSSAHSNRRRQSTFRTCPRAFNTSRSPKQVRTERCARSCASTSRHARRRGTAGRTCLRRRAFDSWLGADVRGPAGEQLESIRHRLRNTPGARPSRGVPSRCHSSERGRA